MFTNHLKTVGLAVAVLVAASSIHNIATAAAAIHREAVPTSTANYRNSIQTAQTRFAAGAALRSISIAY